ncbi:thioredoxin [Escherichia phage EJP2]|nr:thioredoxin [Escherichia phage EJP2]
MNRTEKAMQIEKNFNSMMAALECLLDTQANSINSLIVSGKGGVGKTYNVDKRLQQADNNYEIDYKKISGKVTTMGLYEALYHSRHAASVLLLDDVDIFGDETNIDLLKAVLDTSDKRVVSYATSGKHLDAMGIPKQFEFRGKVIFLTNKNLSQIAKGKSSLAPHIDALITRSIFVDLQLFSNEEVMIHIENVMSKTNILENQFVSPEGAGHILNFMLKNEDRLRSPSLRMPVLIAGLYNKFPFDWESMAENMFLEK